MDFGVRAYCEDPSVISHPVGTWLSGRAHLGIDYYLYFEQLSKEPDVPACIYAWRIERILMNTARFVEVSPRRSNVTRLGAHTRR
jgi:hypothetical protein